MSACDFNLTHYREIIERALTMGYRFYRFHDCFYGNLQTGRNIFLRHDIDVSLEKAVQFAKVEAEFGVRSTYFIRLHARYYQPLAYESWKHLNELCRGEAEIGLHYNRSFYEMTGNHHVDMLARDVKIINAILGKPIHGCASHMPGAHPPFDMATVRSIGLEYEAYAPEFTQARKYLSDSNRNWREGCLCQWLGKEDYLTVLIHPIWWLSDIKKMPEILERIRAGD